MNKDLLLDAIGMVDEQKLREAADIKRTKRVTGCVTVLVVLLALITPLIAVFTAAFMLREETKPYTVEQLAGNVANSNTVTVYPKDDASQSYTVYIPDELSQTMRFEEWTSDENPYLSEQEAHLALHFGRTTLTFYDGYVTAEMYDWDSFEGTFVVPEGLWQEVLETLQP